MTRIAPEAAVLFVLAAAIAACRPYLGMHYPSDVLGGRPPRHRPRPAGAAAVKIGIVGLPNAGKSTLFNALTAAAAETGDYPFTTVEPNVAVVEVPDERLDRVAETLGSSAVVRETIEFHDIAGPRPRRLGGRGPRQPLPRFDPRDRRDLPRDPGPRVGAGRPPRRSGRSARRRRADRGRAARRRPRGGRAPPRAGHQGGAFGRQGGGRRARVARAGGRGAERRPARPRGAAAPGGAGRAPEARAADREAGSLRRQRRRGNRRAAGGSGPPRGGRWTRP